MNIKETLSFLETGGDIRAVEKAFRELCGSVEEKDLPLLLEAVQSKTMPFGIREWLAKPIVNLAGEKSIPELMKALRMNFENGHDNDGLQAVLMELAEKNPDGVREELEKLKADASGKELEDIDWLLEFCR